MGLDGKIHPATKKPKAEAKPKAEPPPSTPPPAPEPEEVDDDEEDEERPVDHLVAKLRKAAGGVSATSHTPSEGREGTSMMCVDVGATLTVLSTSLNPASHRGEDAGHEHLGHALSVCFLSRHGGAL